MSQNTDDNSNRCIDDDGRLRHVDQDGEGMSGEAPDHPEAAVNETPKAAEHEGEPSAANSEQAGESSPFNFTELRFSQDFEANLGVKKVLLTVPVRKPDRQSFIRVHPDVEYRMQTAVLELREERETYLVARPLWPELAGELIPKVLYTVVSRQGVVSIWPIRLPGEDGRHDEWNRSAMEAAQLAMEHWVKVQANMSLGANEAIIAMANLSEPEWPDKTFQELLEVAFRDKYIDNLNHPVLKRLRGET